MRENENKNLTGFLLGRLDEAESAELEKRFFADKTFFEEMLSAENELIDAYVTDKLPAEDRRLFENRLLLNQRQRERVRFARALFEYAAGRPLSAEFSAEIVSSEPSFFSRLFSGKPFLSLAFAATVALIFIGGMLWLILNSQTGNGHRRERAAVQTPQNDQPAPTATDSPKAATTDDDKPADEPKPTPEKPVKHKPAESKRPAPTPKPRVQPSVFAFVLMPGLTRDGGSGRKFTVPAGTDLVRMDLKFDGDGFSAYQALLETVEGEQVWSSGRLKSTGGSFVRVLIPARRLKKADYILSLKGLNPDGIYERVADYSFTVNAGQK